MGVGRLRVRSGRTIALLRGMYSGAASLARELAALAGIPSRWVYPYLRPFIRRGLVRKRWTPLGMEYTLSPLGAQLVRELDSLERGDLLLRELLVRLYRLGLRRRVYRDIVEALYRAVMNKPDVAYVRGRDVDDLADILLELMEERYSREEVVRALRVLHEAGVISFNPPRRYPSAAVAFRLSFVKGLGIPGKPPRFRVGPPV